MIMVSLKTWWIFLQVNVWRSEFICLMYDFQEQPAALYLSNALTSNLQLQSEISYLNEQSTNIGIETLFHSFMDMHEKVECFDFYVIKLRLFLTEYKSMIKWARLKTEILGRVLKGTIYLDANNIKELITKIKLWLYTQ